MLKNYFKIAWRNLWRNRTFSLINIGGLTVGLVSVMLILVFIRYELSYDRYLDNSDRIYRLVVEDDRFDSKDNRVLVGLAKALQKEFAEVENHVKFSSTSRIFKVNGKPFDTKSMWVDPTFFQVFDFELLKGDKEGVLAEPNTVVISEKTAKTWFPDSNPLGKAIMIMPGNRPYRITGIMQNIPENTHFQADLLASLTEYPWAQKALNMRGGSNVYQYVLLNGKADPEVLEKKFATFYEKYDFPKGISVRLQALTDIHLHSNFENELAPNGDIRYIYIFSVSALLILIIACINFVNLSTAKSLHRSREVGMRKVMGAGRFQLAFQFLGESLMLFTVSLLFAIGLAQILLPLFSGLLNIPPNFAQFFNRSTLALFLSIALLFGIIAGLYPALFLSGQRPAFALKGVLKLPLINLHIRKLLVTVQFVIAVVLIAATMVIYSQLQFISHKRLGFDKELLVYLPRHNYQHKGIAFKNELLAYPGIMNVSFGSWNPGASFGASSSWTDELDTTKRINFNLLSVDFDFIPTIGLEIDTGRMFSRQFGADLVNIDSIFNESEDSRVLEERPIILNEAAVKRLGLEIPVGKRLSYPALRGTVVGVVKDFNGLSLHHEIAPMALRPYLNMGGGHTFIRLKPGAVENSIRQIEETWKEFFPDKIFEFSFVDDLLQKQYTAEKRLGRLFILFSVLGIGVSCLGLLGLALFEVQQRTKEIGIRKVLGASVSGIVALLSKDFIKLVLIAIVIATPIAWYAMNNWLQDFAYRINIEWWIFALAGLLAIIIALLTVSFQSVKAALANPVKSLRSE